MELGEEGVTWKLARASCQLSALTGIGEVPGSLIIRCGQLVAKQILNEVEHGRVILSESP